MIHETATCQCELCTWADAQEALQLQLKATEDTSYFDFLWQYGPPSKLVGVTKEQAAWWFQMGRAANG